MENFKHLVKSRFAKALAEDLDQQLALNQKLESVQMFGLAPWYQENLWEPPVQLALRDLCQPGDTVFDVGANFGGLATVMSRMVGPKGIVCAFEASPRIIDKCQRNLVLNGCHNTQLFHTAVYHKSYSSVPIYLGSHLNDSIYNHPEGQEAAYQVSTLALDDFVEHTNLVPNVIKMDIEGAEFDAIQGAIKTIVTAKPHLILESSPEDSRCLDLLREKGYIALDLNTYQEITTAADYPQGAGIRNNLYIHQDRLHEAPYQLPFKIVNFTTLNQGNFQQSKAGYFELKHPLILDRGRYLIDMDFAAQGTHNNMMCGVKISEKVIFRYHAYSQLLAASYRDWVIHLTETCKVNLYFEFLDGTNDETFSIKGANVRKIDDFTHLKTQLYI